MKIKLDDGEVISEAQQVASIVEGEGVGISKGVAKVLSMRLQLRTLAEVEALAHKSKRSRNATLEALLEVGVEEVHKLLRVETMQEVNELTSVAFAQLWEEAESC